MKRALVFLVFLFCCHSVLAADPHITVLTVKQLPNNTTAYNLNIKVLLVMTLITLLPALLMTMTSFTRVVIVLAILRQAIGMPNTPNNQILIGISLFLTLFIMAPVVQKVNTTSVQPYLANQIDEQHAFELAEKPFHEFMLNQTRTDDFQLFMKLAKKPDNIEPKKAPFSVLVPAFLTSELKTAFQMGFLIYIPFLIIDLVVASVLMSMGMMMLSPLVISLPFKIMLFVMVNGWVLVLGTLSASFIT